MNDSEQIRARKRHKCQLCGRAILPGCAYIRQKWFDDGFRQAARHIHCDALLTAVIHGKDEFWPEEITEALRDICVEQHEVGLCTDEEFAACGDTDCYGCELVQRAVIRDPIALRAAMQSARENYEEERAR